MVVGVVCDCLVMLLVIRFSFSVVLFFCDSFCDLLVIVIFASMRLSFSSDDGVDRRRGNANASPKLDAGARAEAPQPPRLSLQINGCITHVNKRYLCRYTAVLFF